MIKKWYITGDTHGDNYQRLKGLQGEVMNEVAIIILGDVAFNYRFDLREDIEKTKCNELGCQIYCVRGNHERDPKVLGFPVVYDENVKGNVYQEEKYPNIKYFIDGAQYDINGKSVGVFGGAYSVDKQYRIATGKRWFPEEQLDEETRTRLLEEYRGKHLDIILAHTCPYSIRPTDLFLQQVNQSTVDNTMEFFLEDLCNNIGLTYNLFLCGHYHDTRMLGHKQFMLYYDIGNLDVLYNDVTWRE